MAKDNVILSMGFFYLMDFLEWVVRSATGYEAYSHYHVSFKEGHMSLIKEASWTLWVEEKATKAL